jgi:ribonuclease P protein component
VDSSNACLRRQARGLLRLAGPRDATGCRCNQVVLPDTERLRRSSLIQRTYAGRKKINASLFTAYVLPRQARSQPRLPLVAVVASKKVHKSAVYRNRVKRRVREAYRRVRDGDPRLKQIYSLVWVIHARAVDASWSEILESVSETSARINSKYAHKEQNRVGKND